jgi:hypothetical protein
MFVHLAIHYPKPEHVDDVLASMRRVDKAAEGAPGLIAIGAWRDQGSDRLVGLAQWESEEAYQATAPRIFEAVAGDPFDEWWVRPPEIFHLTKP